MNGQGTSVKIVVPVYKDSLDKLEWMSLRQLFSVLGNHPIVFIHPVSLDISYLAREFPGAVSESFPDRYFNGIAGYNSLMLSVEFYDRFASSEYILIYQTDAWVFRDELHLWCSAGYDYIGAPWLEKPVYRLPFIRTYRKLRLKNSLMAGLPNKQQLYNKVGNGGLSLRRVSTHLQACGKYSELITEFLSCRHHLYNEDVFWATRIPEFRYPDALEAIRFSFDKYPRYCFRLTGGQLPFGCHGWYKRKMRGFWRNIIGF